MAALSYWSNVTAFRGNDFCLVHQAFFKNCEIKFVEVNKVMVKLTTASGLKRTGVNLFQIELLESCIRTQGTSNTAHCWWEGVVMYYDAIQYIEGF